MCALGTRKVHLLKNGNILENPCCHPRPQTTPFKIKVINNDAQVRPVWFFLSGKCPWWSGLSCPFERDTWSPLAFSPFTSSPSLFSVAMRHSSWSQGFHNSLLEEQKPKHWTKQGRPTQTSSHLTHTSHLWVLCWHTNGRFKTSPSSFFINLFFFTMPQEYMKKTVKIHSKKSTGWRI